MAELEDILVSDLAKLTAEDLRSRGWALIAVITATHCAFADIPQCHQSQGPGESDCRRRRQIEVGAHQALVSLAVADLEIRALVNGLDNSRPLDLGALDEKLR